MRLAGLGVNKIFHGKAGKWKMGCCCLFPFGLPTTTKTGPQKPRKRETTTTLGQITIVFYQMIDGT